MAEPDLGPLATQVRRDDPMLFRTALFAAEPARGRLMTLYAFDIELSRALTRTSEPMIARMRLQWWRDVIDEAVAGAVPRSHEVAAPLHALVAEGRLSRPALDGLVEAREAEIEGLEDEAAFEVWASLRFGGLTGLAARSLGATGAAVTEAADEAGRAMAAAFVLRHAAPMAAAGRPPLLPGAGAESRAALARGETDRAMQGAASALAERGLAGLARARARRGEVPAAARPAFLPLGPSGRVLRAAARGRPDLARLAAPPPGTGALGMLWRAASGRW